MKTKSRIKKLVKEVKEIMTMSDTDRPQIMCWMRIPGKRLPGLKDQLNKLAVCI